MEGNRIMSTQNVRKFVTDLIEGAVALKGEDYVYPIAVDGESTEWGGCDYVRDGQPSCIVGHVLVAAGVPPEQLSRHEGTSASNVVRSLKPEWGEEVGVALDSAQELQDSGSTWSEALKAFKMRLGE
jgi:hypothetical protein